MWTRWENMGGMGMDNYYFNVKRFKNGKIRIKVNKGISLEWIRCNLIGNNLYIGVKEKQEYLVDFDTGNSYILHGPYGYYNLLTLLRDKCIVKLWEMV